MINFNNIVSFINRSNSFKKISTHNKKIFENKVLNTENEILLEFNNFASNQVCLSYFANILKDKYNANLTAYPGHLLLSIPFKKNLIRKIKFFFGKTFGVKFFGVYKSFGVNNFFYPELENRLKKTIDFTYKRFVKNINNLRKLEKFKINNILMGDLLYDTFLKNHYHLSPTIDLKTDEFKDFAYDFICLFYIWYNYIKEKKIKAIIASHAVYTLAIPARICSKKNIDTYILTHEYLWRLKKNHPNQYYEVKNFRKLFKKIKKGSQNKLKKLAKVRLSNRLKGNYTSDYGYITKSPFGKSNKINIKKNNKNIFVIATHDFVDGPHCMGQSLFPDFYQWFVYLCNLSVKTNDIWLVKNHPDFGEDYSKYMRYEREVTENVCKNYKNIKILNKNVSLNDLSRIKVDAVFTVNGTIGVDCPLLNIPVINASINNPHINYSFNYHPKNIKELENIILNFKKYKNQLKIKKNEIYEFYSMRNIFFSKKWFFKDLDKITKGVKSYHNLHKPLFFDYWLKNYSSFNEKDIKEKLKNYSYSDNIFHLNNNNIGTY